MKASELQNVVRLGCFSLFSSEMSGSLQSFPINMSIFQTAVSKRAWFCGFAMAVSLGFAMETRAQSVTFDFEDGTDQGFGHKFSDDASETFPIVNIGGSMRMEVLRTGDFQEADRASQGAGDPFYVTMAAAANDEMDFVISYDWYVDTSLSPGNYGSFLQLGTYVNTSNSGYYAQDFPGAGKDAELNSSQLSSGSVFSGTVTETFSAKGFDMPSGETLYRLGFIINGDGSQAKVYFDNVRVASLVPEPTSLALLVMAGPVLMLVRRRLIERTSR